MRLALKERLLRERCGAALLVACCLRGGPACAADRFWIERLELSGVERTERELVTELLPREPPAYYVEAELAELERRLHNLGIFDQVAVRHSASVIRVELSEKWTLTPAFELVTGSSLATSYIAGGLTEYNAFGRATQVGGLITYEQRGVNGYGWLEWHTYHPRRWAFGMEGSHTSAAYDPTLENAWYCTRTGGSIYWTAPFLYSVPLGYRVGVSYRRELIEDVTGSYAPPSGHAIGTVMELTWDAYSWDDLAPSGYLVRGLLQPAWLFGPSLPESRHTLELELAGAVAFGPRTALLARAVGTLTSPGNLNHSSLLSSGAGVRGLTDGVYFNWAQAFANVELRHAERILPRLALQGALFSDAALFESLDVYGERADAGAAASVGAGVRLVPTFLTELLLRLDLARLVVPRGSWLWQFGVSQYF